MGTKRLLMLMFVLSAAFVAGPEASHAAAPPNVIVILADDLGFGDLGCYGQKLIQTPNLDRMAAEGMRFTQFYAGSTVCAPSRSVLMTGKHLGHTRVRGNAPEANLKIQALRKGDRTLAHTFRDAGYATALFGKWGLGEIGSDGHPNSMGFDEFFGYLNQRHAHNYYPSFLIHNSRRFPLRNVAEVENRDRGDGWARRKVDYSHDVIMTKALRWLKQNRRKPFFLYLAVTLPHANNEATRATGERTGSARLRHLQRQALAESSVGPEAASPHFGIAGWRKARHAALVVVAQIRQPFNSKFLVEVGFSGDI